MDPILHLLRHHGNVLPHTGALILTIICLVATSPGGSLAQRQSECERGSCYPATGDLMIGRENNLNVSSTCGMDRMERYCIVSHLKDNKKCSYCDSRHPHLETSHRIQEIVASFPHDFRRGWWQAENGVENVEIRLDLGAEFHFTHLIMKFKTFRPAAMFIERSYDFGQTWKVYRYFAYDCAESFPGIPLGPIMNINDVICDSRYSSVEPSTEGEVIFRVLPPYIKVEDPYSEEVQDLLKMTNLRVNFTRLHTLGDNLLDSRDEIKEKYYYAMYEMVVRGSCSCYGHASRCVPSEDEYSTDPNMVHGQCECTHHTKGRNCEQCEDFYNDQPWRPARGTQINECQPCDCHNHASRCHFDPSVYELTGRVSGGVCDHCQHNTTGRQCDECAPFFYHHPSRDIRDYDACRACNCDPEGSEHGGECQGRTDPLNNLVAGRCICKRYVQGERCDLCVNGYWNMRSDNPEGCEPCTCDTLGTVGNYGCDKNTGRCRCKRYVTGQFCNECLEGYWGLSEDMEGCQACDCDPGGSVDGSCDQRTGQCTCKPNIIGRRCDQPAPAFFIPDLDYYVYEAETATGEGMALAEERTVGPDQVMTWTGTGFMRVFEGGSIIFTVDNLPISMEYDIIIRYEAQMPQSWDNFRLSIERPGPVDRYGECANYMPRNDYKQGSLPRGNLYQVVSPSSCLETGQSYQIRIDFTSYNGRYEPEASILIDSIVLAPVVDRLDMYESQQANLAEYHHYHCYDYHMPIRSSEAPETCNTHYFSIGATTENMALDCACDPTGSYSHVCAEQGGQCDCKPYVIGRRCDQCAPGNYGFSPQGCMACECNSIGSSDLRCDEATGQCPCMPNVYGRRCDECQRGFWGYPSCRQCQCSGRADECDNETGHCRSCRDNTAGAACDMCAAGFYGDPRPGATIGCRECMCPGGANSGYQHGDTCQLDTRVSAVVCDCHHGYTGYNCDRCADNYFGNPTTPGGICEPCLCNDNVDPRATGNCDATTGECLRCLYNTEGFSCERCEAGYYGDATRRDCRTCICNILGTDHNAGPCDRNTGQCPCLPNVIGQECDRCAPDHWKIASGLGCEACACDPVGSTNTQCNEFDGQCVCIPGRGGRDCSECEANFWGDPDDMCVPCECNPDGSTTQQCDRRTGQCVCEPGVAGLHCDICDRGTTGELPNCQPCGECFDNWDRTIRELANMTDSLVQQGENIKFEGPPGAFDEEFRIMEENLEEIRRIISGANITSTDLQSIEDTLANIKQNLTNSSSTLQESEDQVADNLLRVDQSDRRIQALREKVMEMKDVARQLKENATIIRELDVSGAFNSTQESLRRTHEAEQRVEQAMDLITESEDTRNDVDQLITAGQAEFDDLYQQNEEHIHTVSNSITDISENITMLNNMVCDGNGDPCDAQCGGALCGRCGGVGCDDGAVTKADRALDLAQNTDAILKELYAESSTVVREMESAQIDAVDAKVEAQEAYDRAMEAKNQSENARTQIRTLIDEISTFLTEEGADPADIRMIAEEVLAMSISLTSEEIQDWAWRISETITSLTDIDTILDATRDNLRQAQELKRHADEAKRTADNVLHTAEEVLQALDDATVAQDDAINAGRDAESNIRDAEEDLTLIEDTTINTKAVSNSTRNEVDDLSERVQALKEKFVENELKVGNAEVAAASAEDIANTAELDATRLEDNYNNAQNTLESRYTQMQAAKARVDNLASSAADLYARTQEKMRRLNVLDDEFARNEKTLLDLTEEIRLLNARMALYYRDIQHVAKYHRTCTV